MDKQILFVKSEINSTKALKNRNLVSFHKQQQLSFNQTTLENVDIHLGMYASFHSIDREANYCDRNTKRKRFLGKVSLVQNY